MLEKNRNKYFGSNRAIEDSKSSTNSEHPNCFPAPVLGAYYLKQLQYFAFVLRYVVPSS
jgi:hypothetical protein